MTKMARALASRKASTKLISFHEVWRFLVRVAIRTMLLPPSQSLFHSARFHISSHFQARKSFLMRRNGRRKTFHCLNLQAALFSPENISSTSVDNVESTSVLWCRKQENQFKIIKVLEGSEFVRNTKPIKIKESQKNPFKLPPWWLPLASPSSHSTLT